MSYLILAAEFSHIAMARFDSGAEVDFLNFTVMRNREWFKNSDATIPVGSHWFHIGAIDGFGSSGLCLV